MISNGLSNFKDKRILLLQGPVGPFFRRLAKDLRWAGAQVCKINFNGGDWLFYPDDSVAFLGKPEDWPAFFEKFVSEKNIDVVLLFGDCRPIHVEALRVAKALGLDTGVFEEGYIRPNYITFERFGVNARSALPKNPLLYLNEPEGPRLETLPVRHAFSITALWAMLYYAASHLLRLVFRHYEHHRPLHIWEGLYWIRAFWRRKIYRHQQRRVAAQLSGPLSGNFFLVPLQVAADAQIIVHSQYTSIEDFIVEVLTSFAKHADKACSLVIKHHPLDIGYHNYSAVIKRLARQLGLDKRVLYIHDQSLALLFNNARGVVVINSTTGFSAIHHGCPVKTCGPAFYDMNGLTFQGPLDDFWGKCFDHPPNRTLYHRFRDSIIRHTQVNGNFYRRFEIPGIASGLVWRNNEANTSTHLHGSDQPITENKIGNVSAQG